MTKSILLLFCCLISIAYPQQRPLAVESASLLESGHAQCEAGFSYFRHQPFHLSGLTGNLMKFGTVRFAAALSEFVELQTEGTLLDLLKVTKRDSAFNSALAPQSDLTGDIGDFFIWTKFKLLSEYRSGVGISMRFGVQLPNASNESGLGVDEMNFFSSILLQKHLGGVLTVNAGLGILTDPTLPGEQHDVFMYGAEYSLPVGAQSFVFAQLGGRKGHWGTGVPHLEFLKAGVLYVAGNLTFRGTAVANTAPADHSSGIETSISYHFQLIESR